MRKNRMKGEQRLMGANEAARYLGLNYWTLHDLIWSEAIPLVCNCRTRTEGDCDGSWWKERIWTGSLSGARRLADIAPKIDQS